MEKRTKVTIDRLRVRCLHVDRRQSMTKTKTLFFQLYSIYSGGGGGGSNKLQFIVELCFVTWTDVNSLNQFDGV